MKKKTDIVCEKHEILLSAYELLSDITPKKYDCGKLCSAACCRENSSHGDGEGEYGMLLLPGEKELLDGAQGQKTVSSEEGDMLVCGGSCIRDLRPFACRIFPFYPKTEKIGEIYTIKILPDPRSFGICPIHRDKRRRRTHIGFLRNAKKAVRILMRDEDIRRELISQSDMISDIEALREKIFG